MKKKSSVSLIGFYDKNGTLKKVFPNTFSASTYTGHSTYKVERCLSGALPFIDDSFYLPYSYKLEEADILALIAERENQVKDEEYKQRLIAYTSDAIFFREFANVKEASEETGQDVFFIRESAKGTYRRNPTYYWLYLHDFPTSDVQLEEINRRLNEKPKRKQSTISKSTPIYQYDRKGNFIAKYKNTEKASLSTGIPQKNITRVTNGQGGSTGGFYFLSEDAFPTESKRKKEMARLVNVVAGRQRDREPLLHYDLDGKLLAEFSNADEAEEKTPFRRQAILLVAKGKNPSVSKEVFLYKNQFKNKKEIATEISKRRQATKKKRDLSTISQYTLEKEKIGEFETAQEASKVTGIKPGALSHSLTGKTASCGGYIFLRESQYPTKELLEIELERRSTKSRNRGKGVRSVKLVNKKEKEKVLKKKTPKVRRRNEKRSELKDILHYGKDGNLISEYPTVQGVFYALSISSATVRALVNSDSLSKKGVILLLKADYPTEALQKEEVERRIRNFHEINKAKVNRSESKQ